MRTEDVNASIADRFEATAARFLACARSSTRYLGTRVATSLASSSCRSLYRKACRISCVPPG